MRNSTTSGPCWPGVRPCERVRRDPPKFKRLEELGLATANIDTEQSRSLEPVGRARLTERMRDTWRGESALFRVPCGGACHGRYIARSSFDSVPRVRPLPLGSSLRERGEPGRTTLFELDPGTWSGNRSDPSVTRSNAHRGGCPLSRRRQSAQLLRPADVAASRPVIGLTAEKCSPTNRKRSNEYLSSDTVLE
jgi:hypothetical protein